MNRTLNIRPCRNKAIKTILFLLILLSPFSVQAYAGNTFFLPDYFRGVVNRKAVKLNLGIAADGMLFLKCENTDYPLYDIERFRKGMDMALEDEQKYEHGEFNAKDSGQSERKRPCLLLYDSAAGMNHLEKKHVALTFSQQRLVNHFPIKMIFSDGPHPSLNVELPPGELQYMQSMTKIILEHRDEYVARAR